MRESASIHGLGVVGIVGVGLLCATGCAAELEPSLSAAPIVGGSDNPGDPAVVQIFTRTGSEAASCSGTLITPRIVLTAAHCIDLDAPITAQSVYFGTTTQASDDPGFIESIDVAARQFYPGWTLAAHDVALLALVKDSSVDPLPINRTAIGFAHQGQPLRLVGWGNTSTAGGAGTKRQVTATLDDFNGNLINYGDASANTCQGDSGGPGFMTIGGQEVVVSITSWGTQGCSGESGGMRVDVHSAFIDDFVATHDVPQAPVTDILRPLAGATVDSSFVIEIDATDDSEVDRVELYLDGALVQTGTLAPYIFNVSDVADGPATIEARAYDNRGAMTADSVQVTVANGCTGGSDCPAAGGATGDACEAGGDCASGICADSSDGRFCTQACDMAATCPAGFACVEVSDQQSVCAFDDTSGGAGGCSTGGGTGTSGLPLLLVLLGLALRARATRRA